MVATRQRERERDVNLEHNQAQRKAARLEEQLTEAYARGEPPAKLKTELGDQRRVLREDWPPQVEGARRAKGARVGGQGQDVKEAV